MPTTKIDKQAVLLSYFDDIASMVQNVTYDYVYMLNTDADNTSFVTTMSTLYDRLEVEKFTQLKTYQYNSLIPKIRLYRLDYDTEKNIVAQKQFIFQKDVKYTVSSMTTPVIRDNCGIKSINWKLAGSNPVTSEKQIEVQLEFYFDSINAFSGGSYDKMISAWETTANIELPFTDSSFTDFCEFDATTKNYWSLLFHPQTKKENYDTYKFRIKAEVGWEDIGDNIKSQLKLTDSEEVIKKLNYTFFLNLVKHQFTFNEDGSLQVTANYIASFESSTLNKQFDILGNLQEELESLKNQTLGGLAAYGGEVTGVQPFLRPDVLFGERNAVTDSNLVKALKDAGIDSNTATEIEKSLQGNTAGQLSTLSTLTNAISDPEQLKALKNCSTSLPPSIQSLIKNADDNTTKGTISNLAKISDTINTEVAKQLERAAVFKRRKFYSGFVEKLIDDKKLYTVILDPNTQTNWLNWYNTNVSKPPFPKVVSYTNPNSATTDNVNNVKKELNETIDNLDSNETKKNTVENTETDSLPTTIPITFTTFGDIVENAYKIIEQYLKDDTSKEISLNELKKLKTILSNISDENQIFKYNNSTSSLFEKTNIKNIAFIPIEINVLKSFLIENIIKPKKTTYPLYSFLKDSLATLVIAGVNSFGDDNNNVNKYANLSLGSSLLSLGNDESDSSNDPIKQFLKQFSGPETIVNSIINGSDITTQSLQNFYVNPSNSHTNYYTYFIMYDKTLKDFRPQNDPIKDAEFGVYHYTYAQDYGLIKSINFTKIDQPYLKEAKAVGKQTFYLGQFRDRYNADLTMIGNNIYYPGMMVYIRPSVEAVSSTKTGFSAVTGIGGYYMVIEVDSSITEDGYETKLKTIWQSDGYDLPNRLSAEEQCKSFLQDLGLRDTKNLDSIDQAINKLQNAATIESLESQVTTLKEEREVLYKEKRQLESYLRGPGSTGAALRGDEEPRTAKRRIEEIKKQTKEKSEEIESINNQVKKRKGN